MLVPTTVVMVTTISAMVSEIARSDDAAREDVATELVGAEQVIGLAVRRAEEMAVGRDEPEEVVRIALHEEAERAWGSSCRGRSIGWKVTGSNSPVSTIG